MKLVRGGPKVCAEVPERRLVGPVGTFRISVSLTSKVLGLSTSKVRITSSKSLGVS